MDFKPYLEMMVAKKASDVFVSAGSPVQIKIDGKLHRIGETTYTRWKARCARCRM